MKICARYCGTTILLAEVDTQEEADAFMSNDYILHYADEYEDAYEDEVIRKDEMFIDEQEEIPFCDNTVYSMDNSYIDIDMPF